MVLFECDKELTFVENYVWGNLGWLFCELCFSWSDYTPDSWFWVFSWAHRLGNFFYGLAYERRWKERNGG